MLGLHLQLTPHFPEHSNEIHLLYFVQRLPNIIITHKNMHRSMFLAHHVHCL